MKHNMQVITIISRNIAISIYFARLCSINNIYISCIIQALLLAGDIETNPGPYCERDLSVSHINAQSIVHKLDLIAVELGDFDIITVSETWLDQSISSSTITIPGYQEPIRHDRNRHGGGVAMYFKNSVPFTERTDLVLPNVEATWAEINLNNKKVLLGCFYIHPRFQEWNLVELCIEQALQSCQNLIIIGDFNENLLDPRKCKNIHSILNTYNLNQLIDKPTRVTPYSSSLIDLILTSDSLNCIDKGVIEPFCSDHCAVYFTTNFVKTTIPSYKRKIWLYDRGDYQVYRDKLENADWDFDNLSIDEKINKVNSNIFEAAEFAIPNKEVTIRPKDQPWMHNDVRKAMRKRGRLHKIAKRTNHPQHWANFRTARNHVNKLIHDSKLNYFKKLAGNLQQGNLSERNWWKIAKKFISSGKDDHIPSLIKDNIHFSTPNEKANLLNQYFCAQSNVDDSNASLPPYVPPRSSLDDIVITDQDVLDVLKLINTTKASGPDFIHGKLLKEGADILCKHLSKIFNSSLSTSYFPDIWKIANVVPIFKKGDKTNVSNYRPISLLCVMGKVFEKCVFKYLHNYLVSHNLISKVQSGFTPGDSAVFQLADLYNTFAKAIDDGKEVRVVFCDISKAFDRVWHRGLLFKLRRLGLSGSLLNWFTSYLDNRYQRVAVEGSLSDILRVKAGVPQGSILGPLLFLVYINDIVDEIGTNIRLFADDTSLYMIVEDPNSAADLMNVDLSKIHTWAKQWLVNFNPNKTEELLISRKQTRVDHPPLFMNDVQISRVDQHKHLGLIFNEQCTWHNHIHEITSKAWKRVNILRSLKFQLDRLSLQILYFSYIRPILEYGDIVWDNCFNYEKEEIEKIQIEAGRIVTGATKSCSSSKLLAETGWETLECRRKKHRLTTFYKMINKTSPSYLYNLVPPTNHQVSQRNLRHGNDLQIPRSRTTLYNNSFLLKTSREWNSLPSTVKNSPSLNALKYNLSRDIAVVPKYFYIGSRKAQIWHTRLRLGCSSLNFDLFNNHVSESFNCICGSPETAQHFLLECINFNDIRNETIHLLDVAINIDILLGGCPLYSGEVNEQIFRQVHSFIIQSNRFS